MWVCSRHDEGDTSTAVETNCNSPHVVGASPHGLFAHFRGNAAARREDEPAPSDLFLPLPPCFAVPNAERDSLLFYRELPDDHTVPDWSCGHDHAEDTQEGHQHIQ